MSSNSLARDGWVARMPLLIAFAPAALLPLVQSVLRPRVHHGSTLALLLSSAPDLVVGFCFPFSILIRPRAWSRSGAALLFAVWCVITIALLTFVELTSPFGPNVFDPADLIAGVVGVALAAALFYGVLRNAMPAAAG